MVNKIPTQQAIEVLSNALGQLKATFNDHQVVRQHLNVLAEKAQAYDKIQAEKEKEPKDVPEKTK